MKNIFRILSVALIAGSMLFVACGKEEEPVTPTPSDPTTPTNPTDPTTPTDTTTTPTDPQTTAPVVVNFDGTETEYEVFGAAPYGQQELIHVLAQDMTAYGNGYLIQMWGRKAVGEYPYDSNLQDPWIQMYTGDTAEAQYVSAFQDASETITAIDMNAHILSAVVTATLLDSPAYDADENNVIQKAITITFTEAEWIDLSQSKVFAAKKRIR